MDADASFDLDRLLDGTSDPALEVFRKRVEEFAASHSDTITLTMTKMLAICTTITASIILAGAITPKSLEARIDKARELLAKNGLTPDSLTAVCMMLARDDNFVRLCMGNIMSLLDDDK